jgi:hypothetical protein
MKGFIFGLGIVQFGMLVLLLVGLVVLFLFFTGILEGAGNWVAELFAGGSGGGGGTGRGF